MKTALIILLLSCAGAPAAAEQFPLCMYGVTAPADLAAISKAGFNCFQTYAQEPGKLAELAAAAGQQGLRMLAAPDQVIGSTHAAAAKSWPMLAWYLCDEPEVQRLKPAELEARDRRVKEWDAAQRTAFVMGIGKAAYTYGATADVLMVDWYPVDHLKLESVGYQVMMVKKAAWELDRKRREKPVWAVLQAFNWLEYPQLLKTPVGRFPTFEEVRFMSYLAIARGAAGIFYFTLSHKDGPLYDSPGKWAIYERMAAEINVLLPALEGASELPRPPGLDAQLSAKVLRGGGRTFMLLLNPTQGFVQLNLKALKGWRPLFEEHRDLAQVLPGKDLRWLPAYRVLVLEKRRRFLLF